MSILRLSTFLLITMMLVPIDSSAHCKPSHPVHGAHCGPTEPPDPGGGGEYEAALTSGGFIVSPKDVTPNSEGNSLYGDVPLTMSRGSENMAWDVVFAGCTGLLSKVTGPTDTFTVKGGNWHINGGAGSEIRIRFKNVDFNTRGVDINFDLIGEKGIDESGNPVPVLPDCVKPSKFFLDRFSIFGQAKKGLKAPSCNVQGDFLQDEISVLEIVRTDCGT